MRAGLIPARSGIRRPALRLHRQPPIKDYPGSGGSGSKASVRIQFEYDLLGGKINDLSLNAFNDQDASDAIATVDLLQAGDLIIRDLAYVGL